MAATLGMPLFFSLRIWRERSPHWQKWPVELLGWPLLFGCFLLLPAKVAGGPTIVFIRWLLLLAALHFFAAVAGYFNRREENGFWQFNWRVFQRFWLATLHAGVLLVGLELALLSTEKLFGLKLGQSYADVFFLVAGCFQPAFFLAGVPLDFAALEADTGHPRGLKAYTQFAHGPLIVVFTALLYVYAVKIIVSATWPHGWVALPVLILSNVGIFSQLVLIPLRDRPGEKWARVYCRFFPWALAPLSLLLIFSVRERITAYGVTEQRYLGIVAGGWILAWALVSALQKSAGLRWIPVSLGSVCLVAAYGPWSAGTISKFSQFHHVTLMLERQGALAGGTFRIPDKNALIPEKDYEDLRATLQYLADMHGPQALHDFFGGGLKVDWKMITRWSAGEAMLDELGLKNSASVDHSVPLIQHFLDQDNGINADGNKRIFVFQDILNTYWDADKRTIGDLEIGLDAGVLKAVVGRGEALQPVPLDPFFVALIKETFPYQPPEKMSVDWERNGRSFHLVFTRLDFIHAKEGIQIQNCSLVLMEK